MRPTPFEIAQLAASMRHSNVIVNGLMRLDVDYEGENDLDVDLESLVKHALKYWAEAAKQIEARYPLETPAPCLEGTHGSPPRMKYRKKPVVIEAITFDELVEHGRKSGATCYNGMPWSFDYAGHPISNENDDCYLIPTSEGIMMMGRGDMLITGVKGEIYPCKLDIFAATYEPVETPA